MKERKKLLKLMHKPLPKISDQVKQSYRPTVRKVREVYKLLNKVIFNNQLKIPKIELVKRVKYWGICMGKGRYGSPYSTGSYCVIKLNYKFYSEHWMITTLAHEMVHQYQWDIYSGKRKKQNKPPVMSHGPSFYVWKYKLAKVGITLKRIYSAMKWFTYQKLDKC